MVAEILEVFPCKYLGIPLSLRRLNRSMEQPLVDAVAARIPTWKAGLLTNAGRALLTKVTLSAIPVHISIACCLSQWAISQIDKRCRAFLWAGTESVSGGGNVRSHGPSFAGQLAWAVLVCSISDSSAMPSGSGGSGSPGQSHSDARLACRRGQSALSGTECLPSSG